MTLDASTGVTSLKSAMVVIVTVSPVDRDSIGYPLYPTSTRNEPLVASEGGFRSLLNLILIFVPTVSWALMIPEKVSMVMPLTVEIAGEIVMKAALLSE